MTERDEEQRRNFAYGNAVISNPNVTREMIDEAADKIDQEAALDEIVMFGQEYDAAPDFVGFAKSVMEAWPEGDIDGFELQSMAEKFNLIREIPGGYDPEKHIDAYGVCPEKGDQWFERTYVSTNPTSGGE